MKKINVVEIVSVLKEEVLKQDDNITYDLKLNGKKDGLYQDYGKWNRGYMDSRKIKAQRIWSH